jgi:CRP-like cAMP-binding protein
MSVVSHSGKEAIVGMAGPGEFFGEGCVFDESTRPTSAVAVERSRLTRIEKQDLKYVLRHSTDFCETFLHRIVRQKKELEEALADQLFSSSERRLARILLILSRDTAGADLHSIPRMSQTTLAAMVGTTRSRISFFLGQFRKLGLIESTPEIRVNRARMSAMLRG